MDNASNALIPMKGYPQVISANNETMPITGSNYFNSISQIPYVNPTLNIDYVNQAKSSIFQNDYNLSPFNTHNQSIINIAQAHNYTLENVYQWNPHMLSPQALRTLRLVSKNLTVLPKSPEIGIYFNRNRPSWAVTYWEGKCRKYRHFFIPDLSPETVQLVLKAAIKMRNIIRNTKDKDPQLPQPALGGYVYGTINDGEAYSNGMPPNYQPQQSPHLDVSYYNQNVYAHNKPIVANNYLSTPSNHSFPNLTSYCNESPPNNIHFNKPQQNFNILQNDLLKNNENINHDNSYSSLNNSNLNQLQRPFLLYPTDILNSNQVLKQNTSSGDLFAQLYNITNNNYLNNKNFTPSSQQLKHFPLNAKILMNPNNMHPNTTSDISHLSHTQSLNQEKEVWNEYHTHQSLHTTNSIKNENEVFNNDSYLVNSYNLSHPSYDSSGDFNHSSRVNIETNKRNKSVKRKRKNSLPIDTNSTDSTSTSSPTSDMNKRTRYIDNENNFLSMFNQVPPLSIN